MRQIAVIFGLLVCLLVSEVDGHRRKPRRIRQPDEDQVVPPNACPGGLFDPDGCTCQCNSIGEVEPAMFCWINSLVCATRGTPLSGDCCVDRQRMKKIKRKSCSGSSSGSKGKKRRSKKTQH